MTLQKQYDYEDGEDLDPNVHHPTRQTADLAVMAQEHGMASAATAYKLASPGKDMSEVRQRWWKRQVDKSMAEHLSSKWVAFPLTRLKDTQRMLWWQDRDPERWQIPSWKLLEDATNDLRRAVWIKRNNGVALSGQPSLATARFKYRCEVLYKRKMEARDKQTAE